MDCAVSVSLDMYLAVGVQLQQQQLQGNINLQVFALLQLSDSAYISAQPEPTYCVYARSAGLKVCRSEGLTEAFREHVFSPAAFT